MVRHQHAPSPKPLGGNVFSFGTLPAGLSARRPDRAHYGRGLRVAGAHIRKSGGYRRHTFFTQGQQCLFLRCWSEDESV